MTVHDIATALGLQVAAGAEGLDRPVTGGYASDLLSCVMAKAGAGNAWITLQAHVNVIAVASLLDLACVIITEGMQPDAEMIARADEHRIPTLLTPHSTYHTVGELVRLGIRG
ncbi:MAG TPA: serine kinase [Chloroflexi bacterium]|nr:serine kinase [Chloroflexota bacterium]